MPLLKGFLENVDIGGDKKSTQEMEYICSIELEKPMKKNGKGKKINSYESPMKKKLKS